MRLLSFAKNEIGAKQAYFPCSGPRPTTIRMVMDKIIPGF